MKTLLTLGMLLLCIGTAAQQPAVMPAAEKQAAQDLGLEGPAQSSGIIAVETLQAHPLAGEIEGLEGYMLRARLLTIAPGGVVAVHKHESRPGIALIVAGEMRETRNDLPAARTLINGQTVVENNGLVHWWKNTGATNAQAYVVDIVPIEKAQN